MSWVTVIFSMLGSACLTLGLMHLLVWIWDWRAWANLCFGVTALAVCGEVLIELSAMSVHSAAEYTLRMMWMGPTFGVLFVGTMGFVHFYFGTGRRWLLAVAVSLRVLVMVAGWAAGGNQYIREVVSVDTISLLGEQVTVLRQWINNPWAPVGLLAVVAHLGYVLDAAWRLWRTGELPARRRAAIISGALTFYVVLVTATTLAIVSHSARMPICFSLAFVGMVMAMGYELSREAWRSARLARELRVSQRRIEAAALGARNGFWTIDRRRDVMWASKEFRETHGIAEHETLTEARVWATVQPEDRQRTQEIFDQAARKRSPLRAEYRVSLPSGQLRWVGVAGCVEYDAEEDTEYLLGASLDITERKESESEIARQRNELAHLSRVATVSALSGSLAHELNQPLGIILTNAQVAQRLLAQPAPDVAVLREIVAEIAEEDQRASEVIRRLRALLQRGDLAPRPLTASAMVDDVLRLLRTDLMRNGVMVKCDLDQKAAPIMGDAVQLQQVLLKLILNACDAMAANAPGSRRLLVTTTTEGRSIRISVADNGCGLPLDPEQVFEPFYTTKTQGLGLGLPVCRSLVAAHRGRLWAERAPATPAGIATVFHLELPMEGAAA